jgi:hypothetical protein
MRLNWPSPANQAAPKRRLGYRLENRKLVTDEAEVATVRTIFQRYLAVDGMTPLLTELRTTGVTTRRRTLATSKVIRGIPLCRGALGHLLKNRMYIGEPRRRSHRHQPATRISLRSSLTAFCAI